MRTRDFGYRIFATLWTICPSLYVYIYSIGRNLMVLSRSQLRDKSDNDTGEE